MDTRGWGFGFRALVTTIWVCCKPCFLSYNISISIKDNMMNRGPQKRPPNFVRPSFAGDPCTESSTHVRCDEIMDKCNPIPICCLRIGLRLKSFLLGSGNLRSPELDSREEGRPVSSSFACVAIFLGGGFRV